MSAQMAILQREDLAEILTALKDISPSDIKQLEEAKRTQAQLTETELAKISEARAYIIKYDSLVSDMKKKEDALTLAKSEHETTVSVFDGRVESENKRLAEWETRLDGIAKDQAKITADQAEERKKIDADIKKNNAELDARSGALDSREDEIENSETLNVKEAQRLATWEAKLKAKAVRLAKEAEIDE